MSVADAASLLRNAGNSNSICLGAEGFWLLGDGQVEPSREHILDLSSVTGRSPRTNASLALAVIEKWPEDPSRFAVELVMTPDAYACPCCGHLTMGEPPGSYEICAVCFWEDDAVQLRWPTWAGGANRPNLVDAQQNFVQYGAIEDRFGKNVRPPAAGEPVDEGWRVIDLSMDSFETPGAKESEWPEDMTVLYWWRPTFWRRDLRAMRFGLSLEESEDLRPKPLHMDFGDEDGVRYWR
jgi:hypothetical protein